MDKDLGSQSHVRLSKEQTFPYPASDQNKTRICLMESHSKYTLPAMEPKEFLDETDGAVPLRHNLFRPRGKGNPLGYLDRCISLYDRDFAFGTNNPGNTIGSLYTFHNNCGKPFVFLVGNDKPLI